MINAKDEILSHVKNIKANVEYVKIGMIDKAITICGPFKDVLKRMDFVYDDGYGEQELFGYIWYSDGTWSERREYDGNEWWHHVTPPNKSDPIL